VKRDDFDLSQEVVVLTGAAGILGSRFAHALAGRGAKLALLDREPDKAAQLCADIVKTHGTQARGWTVDIGDQRALAQVAGEVIASVGAPSVLVNAAAAKSANFFEPFESYALADWDDVMRTNVTGAMLASQLFGTGMAERGSGSIVNILSIYGVVAPDQRIYEGSLYEGRAINTPAIYSASKAALWGLTRYLATYWAHKGVRANAITPGGVFSGQNDTFKARYSARVPMGRMADRDEICGALVFLASRASSYVTGQNIVVDGGLTAW
jgi:NAD(P)-dependent dehydrogenase (short-subunit alcohol dehydrogenase family)